MAFSSEPHMVHRDHTHDLRLAFFKDPDDSRLPFVLRQGWTTHGNQTPWPQEDFATYQQGKYENQLDVTHHCEINGRSEHIF